MKRILSIRLALEGVGRPLLGLTLILLAVLIIGPAAQAQSITITGAPIKGVLPIIITAFATQDGTDVLPIGSPDWYVGTLFDTGSNGIYFDVLTSEMVGGVWDDLVLDIRINGLSAIDPATLFAPIYPGTNPPQAEVQDIPIELVEDPTMLNKTLIGGPVTCIVKAVIDYTTTVTRGPYPDGGVLEGPDITFFPAGASVGYAPAITLSMKGFGTTGVPGRGQRFWVYNVSFNKGELSVASPESGELGSTSTRFLYDTGTRPTLITRALADSLGLGATGVFKEMVNGVEREGYYLTSITMTGTGGVYTVLDAPVVVGSAADVGSADAVIGSNLFSQTKVLWDGPNAQLGIGVAANRAPVAEAGANQVIEGTGTTTSFMLNGTGSSDPDGDQLAYTWKDGDGNVVGSEAMVTLSRALGFWTFTLSVADPSGAPSEDTMSVTIQDTTPPSLTAPSDKTVPESDPMGTAVDLGLPTVSDICDPNPSTSHNAPALFALGQTVVTWSALDVSGNSSKAQQTITVVPGTPLNQLGNLVKLINYSVASGGIAPEMPTSLLAKVNAALAALVQGNSNASKVALNDLKALINQVEAQTDKKIVPDIAAEITMRANRIILALGG